MSGLWRTMRPKQWTKNGFIFIPLFFDEKLLQPWPLALTIVGFCVLCMASSAIYIINDLIDIDKDRQHPTKCQRPIPSGQLPIHVAQRASVLLTVTALAISMTLNAWFTVIVVAYLLMQVAYSFWLKNVVIVDVMTIAAGFVLRVAADVPLINVERFSPWLYVFTTLGALFLALGKRRAEITLLQEKAAHHRLSLNEYTSSYLDELINVVMSAAIVVYSLYTFTAVNLPANHTMMLTIPFVLYAMCRYLYLIHVRGEGGAPDELVLRDRPLQVAFALCALTAAIVLYSKYLPFA